MKKSFDKVDVAIGEYLKSLRKDKGFTMQEVADRVGCSRASISLYESGKISISLPMLIKVCDVYSVSYADVINNIRKLVYKK